MMLLLLILAVKFHYIAISDIYNICENLYVKNKNKKYVVIKNLVTPKFCKRLINSGELYANEHTWQTDRHDSYPTTDNEVTEEWREYKHLKKLVQTKISSAIHKMYKINKKHLKIIELFLVKYDMSGQKQLRYHRDGSEFSFVIGLNDGFEGGGTTFKCNGDTIVLGVGDCLIFSGQNKHKGNKITSGQRYILAGFLEYGGAHCESYRLLYN